MLATACARATARAIRVQDALSHRESLDQPILGQLRSSFILVSKTTKTTFKIHHIALSANVLFRLTLPRTRIPILMPRSQPVKKNAWGNPQISGPDSNGTAVAFRARFSAGSGWIRPNFETAGPDAGARPDPGVGEDAAHLHLRSTESRGHSLILYVRGRVSPYDAT